MGQREREGVAPECTCLNNSDFQNHVGAACSQRVFEISKAGRKPNMEYNQNEVKRIILQMNYIPTLNGREREANLRQVGNSIFIISCKAKGRKTHTHLAHPSE